MMKYGDVLKTVKDFFDRSFTDGHTVEVKAKTDAGLSLTGEGVLKGGKFASKVKVAGPKIRNFSVDKVEVASKGTFKAEASLKAIIEGLDIDFALEDGTAASGKKSGLTGGFDYVTKSFSTTVSVDALNGPAVTANGVFETHDAFVGAQAKLDAAKLSKGAEALSAYDFVVGYHTGGFTGGIEVTDKLQTVGLLGHQTSAAGALAAKATVSVNALGKKDGKGASGKVLEGVNVQIGASRKVDSSLTVFGAVNDEGALKVAASNKLSNSTTLLLSADVDLASIGRDVHSVSTKLSFSA